MLEPERIAAQTLAAEHKWKRKIVVGLEVLSKFNRKSTLVGRNRIILE
jgi:hypothetical protein